MAQNFWVAIMAFVTCVVITTVVSMVTTPRTDRDMEGLVYGLTKIPHEDVAWYQRPATLAIIVLVLVILLNIWFA